MEFLNYMSQGILEEVRCRVYGGDNQDQDEERRSNFVRALATIGVVDCPAYDDWVTALQERGWLPERPELEPNPDGPGKIGRWRLTPKGHEEWAKIS